ncbi:MAG TPA: MarR family transcriptional regulator [Sphingomonadaceae bacterium]
MHDPLQKSPGYALRRASHAMMAELAERLVGLGLKMADASVLMMIEANAGVTASQIGRALDIRRANMVPLLKKLEDAGLVERAPIDGKSQGLSLTPSGAARLAEARRVIDAFEAGLLARVPEKHRAHLLPALDALWR